MRIFDKIDYHEVIECITEALEERDYYTAGHSKRVSDMTKTLSILMGFTSEEVEFFHIAAHLHDIGKIGLPDSILCKEGKLTDEEFSLIKEHSRKGAKILSKSSVLIPLADIVLHHHEKYGGGGYPDNLMGDDIPLGSRLIAVCDSIDAMLSKRSYRNPLSVNHCKNEILKNIGIMYDPDIVDVTMQNWDVILQTGGLFSNVNIID